MCERASDGSVLRASTEHVQSEAGWTRNKVIDSVVGKATQPCAVHV